MNANLGTFKDTLFSYKDILIALPTHFDGDSLMAASSVFSALRKIAEEGPLFNLVDFLIPSALSENQKSLVGGGVLKYAKGSLESRSYVISLPKDGKVDKVRWREENDYFKLFITPAYGDLSVRDIKFEEFGASYKLVILVGFENISGIGEAYNQNKSFFDRVPKIVIGARTDYVKENELGLAKAKSVTDIAYEALQTLNIKFTKDTAQLLLNGYIESVGGLLGNIEGKEILERIGSLLDNGAVLNSFANKTVSKGTFGQLQLKQRTFANIKQDTRGILWSTVASYELKDLQIDDLEINVNTPILFNSCQGYDKAFALYELRDGSVCGRIELGDFAKYQFSAELGLVIGEGFATLKTEKLLSDVEREILSVLGGEAPVVETMVSETPSVVEETSFVTPVDTFVAPVVSEMQKEEKTLDSTTVTTVAKDETVDAGLITPAPVDEVPTENLSTDPIVSNGEVFGPPQIFNSGTFGGPFSGMSKN